VLGSTGRTGRQVVRSLVKRGHTVRAGVRNRRRGETLREAPWVIADLAADPAELVDVFAGADAVINCAGAVDPAPDAVNLIDRDGAIGAIRAAERAGVPRYLQLSAMFANTPDQGSPLVRTFLYAKQISDSVLRRSSLVWTVVRAATLTDEPGTGRIAAASHLDAGHISREDVAAVLVGCLLEPATEHRGFDVRAGEDPVAAALRTLS
jgi:uncharacterized protein YbjT (DUF2867 family)